MKNIRKFETISEFNAAYNGDEYLEPWVSLTEEAGGVNYNKVPPFIRVPQYMHVETNMQNEMLPIEEDVYNNIFDYFTCEGFNPATSAIGTTYTMTLTQPVSLYFVGGMWGEFDQNDPECYIRKFIPETVTFTLESRRTHYYSQHQAAFGRFSFDDGDCFEGYLDFIYDLEENKALWAQGESQDNCDGAK